MNGLKNLVINLLLNLPYVEKNLRPGWALWPRLSLNFLGETRNQAGPCWQKCNRLLALALVYRPLGKAVYGIADEEQSKLAMAMEQQATYTKKKK